MSRCQAMSDEATEHGEFDDGEGPDYAAEELEAQVYEEALAEESRNSDYACCECGFVNARGDGRHRGGRCPHTGRCGWCGAVWPCAEHATKERAR